MLKHFGVLATWLFALPSAGLADDFLNSSLGPLRVERMADGLEEPWGLAFLPDGSFLITERAGRLTLFPPQGGQGRQISDIPPVFENGQGGLLDVMVPKDFGETNAVFLSYAQPSPTGDEGATALGWARLSVEDASLDDFTVLFADPAPSDSDRHFGSRIVEAPDGSIYLTLGERGAADLAQDPKQANGKVIHLTRQGQPLTAISDALAGVFSMGHRNPQGAALDQDGRLWVVEHGAQGGDELNLVMAGANYGWPVIAYGKGYDDSKIGVGTSAPGMEQPVHYWDPSIALSGLMIYSGTMFPEWVGDVFTGSLKFSYLARLDPDASYAEEQIAGGQTGRVRDVRQGPDGAIWFLSVTDGAAYRVSRGTGQP